MEFPLYPDLPEEGVNEAAKLIENFKKDLVKAADEAIGNLYCNVMPYINSDTWTNFRNDLIAGLKGYSYAKKLLKYDFVKIRAQILEEHRDEIIADLNQDLLNRVAELEAENNRLREDLQRRYQ